MAHKEVARRRLVLDELLRVQLALVQRKRHIERTTRGIAQVIEGPLLDVFVDRLPFDLTADQRAAIAEIGGDLAAPHPMHRLLQGDVGAARRSSRCGRCSPRCRAATRVRSWRRPRCWPTSTPSASVRCWPTSRCPTRARRCSAPGRVRVELLTNKVGAADRRRILAALAAVRSTSSSAPTPSSRRASSSPRWARSSSTSSTASASSSGRRCGTRPGAARSPTSS